MRLFPTHGHYWKRSIESQGSIQMLSFKAKQVVVAVEDFIELPLSLAGSPIHTREHIPLRTFVSMNGKGKP